jgi:hypothetical protein
MVRKVKHCWHPRLFLGLVVGLITPAWCQAQPLPETKKAGFEEFSLELPTFEQLFRPESQAQAQARLRQSAAQLKVKTVGFPPEARVPFVFEVPYADGLPQVIIIPANVTCFRHTYFDDPSTEQGGQPGKILLPFCSALRFYGQGITLPLRLLLTPPGQIVCRGPNQGVEIIGAPSRTRMMP